MLKTILKIVIALAVVLAIAIAVVGRPRMLEIVFGTVEYKPIDFRTLKRDPRPNQYLMCPPNHCRAKVDAISPVFEVTDVMLRRAWLVLMHEQSRIKQVGISPRARQYDFVVRSRWFSFPDTITVQFIALPMARATLAVYSRSHYGRSDLGVNRKRIEGWMEIVTQRLADKTG